MQIYMIINTLRNVQYHTILASNLTFHANLLALPKLNFIKKWYKHENNYKLCSAKIINISIKYKVKLTFICPQKNTITSKINQDYLIFFYHNWFHVNSIQSMACQGVLQGSERWWKNIPLDKQSHFKYGFWILYKIFNDLHTARSLSGHNGRQTS